MYLDYSVIDIETDGLLDTATKIHCMCVHKVTEQGIQNLVFTDPNDMRLFLKKEHLLIGHNLGRFDIPAMEMLLGIEIGCKFIDTLILSWYLYPLRTQHGLEEWGENFGIPKPPIVDWKNEPVEVYVHRCTEDVKINTRLLHMMMEHLMELYDNNFEDVNKLISYLTFKIECAREQEEVMWKLDIEKCRTNLDILLLKQEEQKQLLKSVMPRVITYKDYARPKVCYKKDGTPSMYGQAWLDLLQQQGLPDYHVGTLRLPAGDKEANPNSSVQIKNWLFSLGWVPDVYKYVKEDDGSMRKIPQINEEGEICDSVAALYDVEPSIAALEGLSVLQHRIGILKGFLENVDSNGYLQAKISGITNTLRFKHSVIVNLPTIHKAYGELIRGCLTVPDGYLLCGADMSGLEDSTKRHYMYYFDPEYVMEQLDPKFDPHMDLAVTAGMVTPEEALFFKNYNKEADNTPQDKAEYKRLSEIRVVKAKKANFSSLYGAGAPKISLAAKIPLSEAKTLHTAYWIRNKAVKDVAAACITKTIRHQDWLFNPVSRLWYSLRAEKDKFSTLNQGTAVWCFDKWVYYIRRQNIKMCGQFHDEVGIPLPEDDKEIITQALKSAIQDTNETLNLNVPLRISIDFGHNYAETH